MSMKEKSNDLKLKIELVPSSSWYDNLRKYTAKKDWDKIRKKAYAGHGYRCGICGAGGRMNWQVDLREYKKIIKWRY